MTTAIETLYKGYRFRSRLEARWAVFFDAAGVEWRYEPQGYRLGPIAPGVPYLPDFWLPAWNLWVEVKGSADRSALATIGMAAAADGLPISLGDDRRPADLPDDIWTGEWYPRVLVLGDIPDSQAPWVHPLVGYVGGGWIRAHHAFFWGNDSVSINWLGNPRVEIPVDPDDYWPHGSRDNRVALTQRVITARGMARAARFEHGESGAAA